MHHYHGPKGTLFHFNSDMSGDVRVASSFGEPAMINGEDLVAFVTHWFANYRSDPDDQPAPEPAMRTRDWPAGPPTEPYQQTLRATLAHTMAEISEDGFCAQWMMGLEFDLWDIITGRRPVRYGQTDVTLTQVGLLLALSEATGGWIHWDDQLDREAFIPIDEWRKLVAARPPS
jgi:hypothetical protein